MAMDTTNYFVPLRACTHGVTRYTGLVHSILLSLLCHRSHDPVHVPYSPGLECTINSPIFILFLCVAMLIKLLPKSVPN